MAPGERAPRPYPSLHAISPGFADAIGLRIVQGRTFSAASLLVVRLSSAERSPTAASSMVPPWDARSIKGRTRTTLLASSKTSGSSTSTSRPARRCSSSTSLPRHPALVERTSPCGRRIAAGDQFRGSDDRPPARCCRNDRQRRDDGADRVERGFGPAPLCRVAGWVRGRGRDIGRYRYLRDPGVHRHTPHSRDRHTPGARSAASRSGVPGGPPEARFRSSSAFCSASAVPHCCRATWKDCCLV